MLGAMMFILPAKLNSAAGMKDVGYIYGCATHPLYRNKGIMTDLIRQAIYETRKKYSAFCLVPAERSLFRFYQRIGFYEYFYKGVSLFSRSSIDKPLDCRIYTPGASDIEFIYKLYFDKRGSCVRWPKQHIEHCLQMNETYGGKAIAVAAEGEEGFAFVNRNGKTVTAQFVCPEEIFQHLAYQVSLCFDAQSYSFETHTGYRPLRIKERCPAVGMLYTDEDTKMLFDMEDRTDGMRPYLSMRME